MLMLVEVPSRLTCSRPRMRVMEWYKDGVQQSERKVQGGDWEVGYLQQRRDRCNRAQPLKTCCCRPITLEPLSALLALWRWIRYTHVTVDVYPVQSSLWLRVWNETCQKRHQGWVWLTTFASKSSPLL
jgi:hypothetical protein